MDKIQGLKMEKIYPEALSVLLGQTDSVLHFFFINLDKERRKDAQALKHSSKQALILFLTESLFFSPTPLTTPRTAAIGTKTPFTLNCCKRDCS